MMSMTDWDPSDIKAALEKKGMNLSRLSRNNGLKSRILGNGLRVSYLKSRENLF